MPLFLHSLRGWTAAVMLVGCAMVLAGGLAAATMRPTAGRRTGLVILLMGAALLYVALMRLLFR